MKTKLLFHTKRFIDDESGVYAVMGGLLALPIIALMFVSLEGAALIQDKARLSDSLEQAVLSLTAENNSGRKEKDYRLPGVTDKDQDSFNISSSVGKRDHQITAEFVKAFLPQTNDARMHLTPLCKTVNQTNQKGHTASSEVTCTVSGIIDHPAWFPLKVGDLTIIPDQVSVGGQSRAIKKNKFNIPIDVMVVADLSGSMAYDLTNTHNRGSNNSSSKLGILKDVLKELTEKSLFSSEANENNRIAVAPFALGAQSSSDQCVLPFVLRTSQKYSYSVNDYTQKEDMKETVTEYLSSTNPSNFDRVRFAQSLAYLVDIEKTINAIGKDYPTDSIKFNKNRFCLGDSNRNDNKWYTKQQSTEFNNLVSGLQAVGSTLVNSGLLNAATIMLKEESRTKTLKEETKRVILVLSDGNDELTAGDANKGTPLVQYTRMTKNFLLGQEESMKNPPSSSYGNNMTDIEGGKLQLFFDSSQPKKLSSGTNACTKIRDELNKHNGDSNTKIVFVEFGYKSGAADAWKSCVGNDNYYSANDKESLLNAFKQAIGETDDIGRSIN